MVRGRQAGDQVEDTSSVGLGKGLKLWGKVPSKRLKSGSVPHLLCNIEMLLASLVYVLIWEKMGRIIGLLYCEDFVMHAQCWRRLLPTWTLSKHQLLQTGHPGCQCGFMTLSHWNGHLISLRFLDLVYIRRRIKPDDLLKSLAAHRLFLLKGHCHIHPYFIFIPKTWEYFFYKENVPLQNFNMLNLMNERVIELAFVCSGGFT